MGGSSDNGLCVGSDDRLGIKFPGPIRLQAFGRPVKNDRSRLQADDSVGKLPGEIDLMKADDHRQLVGAANAVEQAQKLFGCYRIKAGDGFIGEQESWLLYQCAGDTDALLLAAGKLIGPPKRVLEKADPVDRLQGRLALVTRPGPKTRQVRVITKATDQNVVKHGEPTDQVMLLKDHAGVSTMLAQLPSIRQVVDSGCNDPAACRKDQSVERPQKSRLAGSRGAEQYRERASLEIDRATFQCLDAVVKNHFDLLGTNQTVRCADRKLGHDCCWNLGCLTVCDYSVSSVAIAHYNRMTPDAQSATGDRKPRRMMPANGFV